MNATIHFVHRRNIKNIIRLQLIFKSFDCMLYKESQQSHTIYRQGTDLSIKCASICLKLLFSKHKCYFIHQKV